MTRRYTSPLREEQASATRERILEALVRVLARGAAELSVPAVAAEAGVSVATVYRHFATKQALLDGLGEHVRDRWLGELPTPSTPAELAALYARAYPRVDARTEAVRAAFASSAARGGRKASMKGRLARVESGLAPLEGRVTAEDYARLRSVAVLLTASETVHFLRELLGLSVSEAADTAAWTLLTLVRALAGEEAIDGLEAKG
jgi:AcrR family transcriptional regulator